MSPPAARRHVPLHVAGLLIALAAPAAAAAAPGSRLPPASSVEFAVPGLAAPPDTAARPAAGLLRRSAGGALRADRLSHATLALAAGVGVGIAAREPAAGAGVALALAAAKEVADEHIDRGDLIAGAVGAALAWWMVAALGR